jgi:N-acetylneuraminic acid mutarotase
MKYAGSTALLFSLLVAAQSAFGQEDSWTSVASMPTARESVAACAIDGYIYAIGGFPGQADPGIPVNERYDPETNAWTTMQPMPTGRRMPATAVVDGKCYVMGGRFTDGPAAISVVEVYDSATDSWETRQRMPTPRYAHSAAVVDGIIYVFGGTDNGAIFSTVLAYDPQADSWSTLGAAPGPARALMGAAALGRKIYVMGGTVDGMASRYTRLDIYDPASDSWTSGADMPYGRFSLQASAINGRVYAIGGADGPGTLKDVTAYDPQADSWSIASDMITERARFATAVTGGRIYAMGGSAIFGNPHRGMDRVERYTPLPGATTFTINPGIADAWYNPATAGQGLLITVFEDLQQMFVAWFTYDVERPPDGTGAILGEPGHRWLTAQGPYSGDSATLKVSNTVGGIFDSPEPAPTTDPAGVGEMTIEFADCENGLLTYELTLPAISGQIPIQRIAPDNVPLCQVLSGQ